MRTEKRKGSAENKIRRVIPPPPQTLLWAHTAVRNRQNYFSDISQYLPNKVLSAFLLFPFPAPNGRPSPSAPCKAEPAKSILLNGGFHPPITQLPHPSFPYMGPGMRRRAAWAADGSQVELQEGQVVQVEVCLQSPGQDWKEGSSLLRRATRDVTRKGSTVTVTVTAEQMGPGQGPVEVCIVPTMKGPEERSTSMC